ncbi:MAG: DUF4065 domain-containing protein [Gammaproteobacteria bacterium]|nr:DUF4065 domain-containing protein [Gammaproteobacteria bacterium]
MTNVEAQVYPVGAIANFMIGRSMKYHTLLTHLQLQRLVYIAYGFGLAIFNRRLFTEAIQVWRLGPVVPDLYHEFKRFGPHVIREWSTYYDYASHQFVFPAVDERDGGALLVLNRTWNQYGNLPPSDFVPATDQYGALASVTQPQPIEDHLIRQHFQQLLYGQTQPATHPTTASGGPS